MALLSPIMSPAVDVTRFCPCDNVAMVWYTEDMEDVNVVLVETIIRPYVDLPQCRRILWTSVLTINGRPAICRCTCTPSIGYIPPDMSPATVTFDPFEFSDAFISDFP